MTIAYDACISPREDNPRELGQSKVDVTAPEPLNVAHVPSLDDGVEDVVETAQVIPEGDITQGVEDFGNDVAGAALTYAARGWPVFPCAPRDGYHGRDGKQPLTTHGFHDATTDTAQIEEWWNKYPEAAIGCPTGPASGFFVLDVDLPAGPSSLAALKAKHGELPPTREQQTGSGGRQLLFAYPESREVHNSASKLGRNLDVRGDGGYVILPPSGHPTGGTYAWTAGQESLDAPDWLLELLAPKTEPFSPPRLQALLRGTGSTPYGEAALNSEKEKVASTPPGGRNHALNSAAFSCAQLVAGGELEQDEVKAGLLEAAFQAGLPEGEAGKTIASGFKAGEKKPRTAPEKPAGPTQCPPSQEVRACAPVPFDTVTPPPIPPEIVPGILGRFAAALAEAVQVPFELALCNVLGTVAVAAQRKFRVRVKDGYSEGLNLYALCPLPPGERKSATVEACKQPLVEWQRQARLESADAIRDAESERKTMEKAIETKRQIAAKATTPEARREFVEEIKAMERELPEVPVSPRLLADDFTPEALGVLMALHEQRIGVLEAEGGLFDTLGGKYSNGIPNIDAVLKFWSGESCQIDRRGREAIFLDDPHLTLCISPQPDVVRGLVDKPGFRGRGLIGRFLFFMPQSRLGTRRMEPTPLPANVVEAWGKSINALLALPWAVDEHGEKTALLLRLEPGAYTLWRQFAETVEEDLRSGGEFEHMTDWAGKFPGQAVRLAGLLHVATVHDPHLHDISEETMQSALAMAAILAEHAKAAYSLMGTDPAQECARAILRWIERDHVERFTARDALQRVKGRFPTMEKVGPGLALLEERAFIFPEEVAKSGVGRRPSQRYTVHPMTWREG